LVADAKATESNKRDSAAFAQPEDLKAAQSFRGSLSGYERDKCFLQQAPGAPYLEAGYALGLDFDDDGRAVAALDVDGDGDLDLAMLSLQRLRLLQNDGPPGRFARLRLRATRGEAHAVGAVVTLTAGGRAQVDRVRLTAGFQTQVSAELHFGLGAASAVDRVQVRWPSGATETFTGVQAGQRNLLVEGAGASQPQPIPSWPKETRPAPRVPYDLRLPAADAKGQGHPLGTPGRATVVNFWAPWCAACERELPALSDLAKARADVDVVGVSVEVGDRAGALAYAEKKALSFGVRFADDAIIEAFFGKSGRIDLPATFVFDATGRLQRAFRHEIDRAGVEAALKAPR
jgi:thiol-disulfide isomerase/thioredoxin